MNSVQFKDLLSCLCPSGAVVSSLSLTQEIVGSYPAIILIFLSVNSANLMKTFGENSIVSVRGHPHRTREFPTLSNLNRQASANHTEEYFMERTEK